MSSLLTKLISETSSGKKVAYTPEEWQEIGKMGLPLIRFFSLFPDTIFMANEANRLNMNGHQARLFFLGVVSKRYRRGTWPKTDTDTVKYMEALAKELNISYQRTKEIWSSMPPIIIDSVLDTIITKTIDREPDDEYSTGLH